MQIDVYIYIELYYHITIIKYHQLTIHTSATGHCLPTTTLSFLWSNTFASFTPLPPATMYRPLPEKKYNGAKKRYKCE